MEDAQNGIKLQEEVEEEEETEEEPQCQTSHGTTCTSPHVSMPNDAADPPSLDQMQLETSSEKKVGPSNTYFWAGSEAPRPSVHAPAPHFGHTLQQQRVQPPWPTRIAGPHPYPTTTGPKHHPQPQTSNPSLRGVINHSDNLARRSTPSRHRGRNRGSPKLPQSQSPFHGQPSIPLCPQLQGQQSANHSAAYPPPAQYGPPNLSSLHPPPVQNVASSHQQSVNSSASYQSASHPSLPPSPPQSPPPPPATLRRPRGRPRGSRASTRARAAASTQGGLPTRGRPVGRPPGSRGRSSTSQSLVTKQPVSYQPQFPSQPEIQDTVSSQHSSLSSQPSSPSPQPSSSFAENQTRPLGPFPPNSVLDASSRELDRRQKDQQRTEADKVDEQEFERMIKWAGGGLRYRDAPRGTQGGHMFDRPDALLEFILSSQSTNKPFARHESLVESISNCHGNNEEQDFDCCPLLRIVEPLGGFEYGDIRLVSLLSAIAHDKFLKSEFPPAGGSSYRIAVFKQNLDVHQTMYKPLFNWEKSLGKGKGSNDYTAPLREGVFIPSTSTHSWVLVKDPTWLQEKKFEEPKDVISAECSVHQKVLHLCLFELVEEDGSAGNEEGSGN